MERETRSCRWNSARTATRSDLSSRETWDLMNRSNRTGLEWSRLSSLATISPSFPISFFRLHIDRLGLDAEPVTRLANRSGESIRVFGGLEMSGGESFRRLFVARRSILLMVIRWRECHCRELEIVWCRIVDGSSRVEEDGAPILRFAPWPIKNVDGSSKRVGLDQ